MAVRPGYITSNLPGKQASAPAVTPANQNSGYVFSTASTTTLGGVTVTKKTATPSSGNPWTDPGYNSETDSMTFNGSAQSLAYAVNSNIHAAPLPFSMQVDFNTTKITSSQYIVNLGQGSGVGYPEVVLILSNSDLRFQSSSNNTSGTLVNQIIVSTIQPNTWYRVGIMIYNVSGTIWVRGYVNGEVKMQRTLNGTPWTSTAGLTIGNDAVNSTGYFFQGQIRNFFLDNATSFWPI